MRDLGCFAMLVAALAASAAQAQTPQQPPTFRANANVVQVDVRVFKGNQFVTGLGLGDFTVTEDGVPQKVESVVLIGAPSAPAPFAPSAPAPLAPLAPSAPFAPSFWLFVFDTPHLNPAGLKRTRDAVLQFLDAEWRQGDIGGIVYDGRMANNRLTSDRAELRAAVAAIKMPGNERTFQFELTRDWPRFQDEHELIRVAADNDQNAITSVVQRACADDPSACQRGDPTPDVLGKAQRLWAETEQSTLKTLSTVVALANGLSRMPGPKTVVFLSDGFVSEKMDSQIRNAVGDAARAGAHFYALDARGLDHGSAGSSIIDQPHAESLIGRTPHLDALVDGPNSLAVDTGGFAIRNENNFGKALDEIRRDASEYYVIGYSPTNSAFDGKYRTIDVEVKQPGLKVRARRGYLALAPALLLKPVAAAPSAPSARAPLASAAPSAPSARTPVPDVAQVPPALNFGAMASRVLTAGPSADAASAVRTRVEAGVLSLERFGASDVGTAYTERGWEAYERGDIETAAAQLSTAVATDSRPWVSYVLGYAQFGRNRYRDAVEAWRRVTNAVPQFEAVYFNLADALSLQGMESDAIKVLRDAEKRWPQDAEVEDALGVIEVRRTAIDAAIKSFDRATTLAPNDPVGYFNLGRAYQMRFNQSQRYDRPKEKWIGNDDDRTRSIAAYQKYVEMHGPYEQQANEAIAALQWKK